MIEYPDLNVSLEHMFYMESIETFKLFKILIGNPCITSDELFFTIGQWDIEKINILMVNHIIRHIGGLELNRLIRIVWGKLGYL